MERRNLDFSTIVELANDVNISNFQYFGDRIIHQGAVEEYISLLDEYDEVLLKRSISKIRYFRRENMQIKLHCFCGKVLLSKIIRGTESSVSHFQEIKNLCYDLILKAKQSGLDINYIEVAHTHLGEQYVILRDGRIKKVISKGLSAQDIATILNIKPFIDYKILLKSIGENEVAYCKYL